MKRYHYLLSLLFVFGIPTAFAGLFLSRFISLEALSPFIVLVTSIGSIWDVWATRHGKKDRMWLWQFNQSQTIGVRFLGLPIEEYLFYVVSSVYVVFMWDGLKLMVLTDAPAVYITIGTLAAWTCVCIFIPYVIGKRKGDRLVG